MEAKTTTTTTAAPAIVATMGKDGKARCTVTTPVGRVSFPHLTKPDTGGQYSDDKFKVSLLFPKDSDLSVLKNAVSAVAKAQWGEATKLKEIQLPFRDGNEKEKLAGYPDHIYVTAKSKNKPGIVGRDRNPLPEGEEVYGGCYARARLTAYTYVSSETVVENGKRKTQEVKGVSFTLESVQFVRDGERFGGGANKEFPDDLADDGFIEHVNSVPEDDDILF